MSGTSLLYKQSEIPEGASIAYLCKSEGRRKHCVHNEEWECSWPDCKHTCDEKYALYPREDRLFQKVEENKYMEVEVITEKRGDISLDELYEDFDEFCQKGNCPEGPCHECALKYAYNRLTKKEDK